MLAKCDCSIYLMCLLFMCGYLFAQEPPQEAEAPVMLPSEIPQGFGAQVKKEQEAEAEPEPQPEAQPVAEAAPQPPKEAYPFYEAFLDSVEIFAKAFFAAKQGLDSLRTAINNETLEPKGQYEKQSTYESRKANFGKIKKQKLAAAEKKHKEGEEKAKDKLLSAINLGKDIQPDWQESLERNSNAYEYQKRMNNFKQKISDMNIAITRVNNFLERLEISQGDMDALAKKNNLYLARLERAGDLMNDYILQEYSKVLPTEKKAYDMTLNPYDAEKEEYVFNLRDINSQAVPFDYYGVVKIDPALARIIDGKTEGFTAVIDYVNYPFTAYGVVVYPGAKEAHLFFRDQEFKNTGTFKSIEGYDNLAGYVDWAVRVDSLITGKLKPRNLDPSFAMKKVSVGPYFWNTRRVLRATAFVLSAASLGVAIWQNSEMSSKAKSANKLYEEALVAAIEGNKAAHSTKSSAYDKKVDSWEGSQYARNGFYISAGIFGIGGIMTFVF